MAAAAVSPRHTIAPGVTTVPLLALKPGAVGVLQNVLDPQSRRVLRSLGLTDGARLRICRVGDPCIIQVRSTRIGLSKTVAQCVYVTVTDDEV
jgi:Fe2+ transport system protein FeoA